MKKTMKKLVIAMMLMCTLMMNVMPVHAEKKWFSFSASGGVTRRIAPAKKADGEQAAYITVTNYPQKIGTCMGVDNGSQNGAATDNYTFTYAKAVKLGYYNKYASKKYTYYLYYETIGSGKRSVAGRYNP